MKTSASIHYSAIYQDDLARLERVISGLLLNGWPAPDVVRQARVSYRSAWAREQEREANKT